MTGGAGFSMDAIRSLNQNRNLRKQDNLFNQKEEPGTTKYDSLYTPEELAEARATLKQEIATEARLNRLLALGVVVLLTIAFVVYKWVW